MNAIETASAIADVFEGFSPRPYLCPAGIWTIGKGTTVYPDGRKVQPTDPPITEETATELMNYEMKRCVSATLKYCPVLVNSPGRLGAIADFVYNLGPGRLKASTLRRRINQCDWASSPMTG